MNTQQPYEEGRHNTKPNNATPHIFHIAKIPSQNTIISMHYYCILSHFNEYPHWNTGTPSNHTKKADTTQNPTTPHPTQQHREKQKAQPLADCSSVALYNMVRAFPCLQGQKPKTP